MDGTGIIGSLLGTFLTMALGLALMFGGPVLYVVLQVRALWRWSGAWRLAALPPALLMGAALIYTGQLVKAGSNLAPMLVIFAVPVALAWLLVAGAVRNRALR